MGCPTIKKAFEDSLNKADINNTDEFLVYDNGTIYNVTFGDMALQMGLTGALTGQNGGGAVPVLNGTAPDYLIRGIVGGNGISAQLNVSGSITINANLQNAGGASAGQALIVNNAADQIKFRRLKAGSGIQISSNAESLTITNSQAIATGNTVLVASMDDFPAAVGGVITLADNTIYNVINQLSTSSRFLFGANTVLTSPDGFVCGITYTGVGAMLTFQDGISGANEIGLSAPNGSLIDTSGVTSGALLMRFIYVGEVKDLGVLETPSVGLYDWFIILHTGNGFTFGNTANRRLNINNITFAQTTLASADIFELGNSTFVAFNIDVMTFLSTTTGQNFIKGLAAGANINSSSIGYVSKVTIAGDMTMLDGITVNDSGWDFTDNNKVADTDPAAALSLNSATATTISVAGTPVQINGTFTAQNAQQYTVAASGTVTYRGRRNKLARVDMTVSLEPSSGTNKDLFLQIAKNGTVIAVTKITRRASAGAATVVSIDWLVQLSTNDTVSVWVGNSTDTTSVLVNQCLLRVS